MKGLLLGGAMLAILGYAWMGRDEANVYDLTPADAYAKLSAASIPSDGKTAFGTLTFAVSGDGASKIYWSGSGGTFASARCEAEITPEGSSKSRVMAFCNGGSLSDGAAAGMVSGMQRKALIEHIDATLDGRAFDVVLAGGSTASGWPSDSRQPDGSLGTAVGNAYTMEREIRQMGREMEKDLDRIEQNSAERMASARAAAEVQFEAGRPATQLR